MADRELRLSERHLLARAGDVEALLARRLRAGQLSPLLAADLGDPPRGSPAATVSDLLGV